MNHTISSFSLWENLGRRWADGGLLWEAIQNPPTPQRFPQTAIVEMRDTETQDLIQSWALLAVLGKWSCYC